MITIEEKYGNIPSLATDVIIIGEYIVSYVNCSLATLHRLYLASDASYNAILDKNNIHW